jgi:RNA polymerase sigma-70 factor, ECF subfamily
VSDDDSLNRLLSGLRAGDDTAAKALFEKYANRLIFLARSRLDRKLRQKFDAEDIAQSVFRSFFRRQMAEPFNFESWGGLWGMLVVITIRKCGKRADLFHAARRDVRREIHPPHVGDDTEVLWDFPCGVPTPDEVVAVAETVERVMSRLDERTQKVMSLRLQGFSLAEIAQAIARTERSVQRALHEIRAQLGRELT